MAIKDVPKWMTFNGQTIRLRALFRDTLKKGLIVEYDPTTALLTLSEFDGGSLILQLTDQTSLSALSFAGHLKMFAVPGTPNCWTRLQGYQCLITHNCTSEAEKLLAVARQVDLPYRVFHAAPILSISGKRLYLSSPPHEFECLHQKLEALTLAFAQSKNQAPATRPTPGYLVDNRRTRQVLSCLK